MAKHVTIIVLLSLVSTVVFGEIVPIPGTISIDPVFKKSDLVCSCFVQNVRDTTEPIEINGAPAMRHNVIASLVLRDVYKGSVPEKTVLLGYETAEQQGIAVGGSSQSVNEGETALMFLRSEGGASFGFADPYIGATSFSVLPQVAGKTGIEKLEEVLFRITSNGSRGDTVEALHLLQGIDRISLEFVPFINSLSASVDPEIAIPAIGVLLKVRPVEGTAQLRRFLKIFDGNNAQIGLISVGNELGRVTDDKALSSIEALSGSRVPAIRHGAMDAIRRLKDPKSAPVLIVRLDDKDPIVQYVAVITLAEIFGKLDEEYAPTMATFDDKPGYYVGLWKQWWAESGKH